MNRAVRDTVKILVSILKGISSVNLHSAPQFRYKSYDQINRYLRTALVCVVAQRVEVICYRRFGTTYRSHFQGSRIQSLFDSF